MTPIKKIPISRLKTGINTFITDEGILRIASNDFENEYKILLQSGLLQRLNEEGLMPNMLIDFQSESSPLTIQEQIDPAIFPYEWSPEMLRSAALCVLKVNQIANQYGYELVDAHPYNVVFKYSQSLWVDVGSFKPASQIKVWNAEKEFMECYVDSLKIAERGLLSIFQHLFLLSGNSFNGEQYTISRSSLQALNTKYLLRIRQYWYILKRFRAGTLDQSQLNKLYRKASKTLLFVLSRLFFPHPPSTNYAYITRKIKRMRFSYNTTWGSYHEKAHLYDDNNQPLLSDRLSYIFDLAISLKPSSVLELAGNQGILSRAIARNPGIKRTICSDYDHKAIDSLFLNIQNTREKLYVSRFNFMISEIDLLGSRRPLRMTSDLVIALAVVHHLSLSQGFSFQAIIEQISLFSRKYIIVEFMPKGLWNGIFAPPLPAWYSEDEFVACLRLSHNILIRHQLESNRVVFLLEKNKSSL